MAYPATKALACAFCSILNQWLTPEQLTEINRLNSTPEYQDGSCASHNFCDPNQAMIDACVKVWGREPEFGDIDPEDKDTDAINEAWSIARKAEFNPSKV